MTVKTGRIDAHCHLLTARDDGCQDLEESLACARWMVESGYTHAFCTPHIWPSYPHNTVEAIPTFVQTLQHALDRAGIPLTLMPGGELNLREGFTDQDPAQVVTYGMRRRHALVDIWCQELPAFFEPSIRWLQDMGLTVILAHPERMRAVQDNPSLADYFADMGLLLQANYYCLADPPESYTRRVIEQFLHEGRYFMLGSDTHRPNGIAARTQGLLAAEEIVGAEQFQTLIHDHPMLLME